MKWYYLLTLHSAGFEEVMKSKGPAAGITESTLLMLQISAAVGATALGAKAANFLLPLDYNANAKIFYTAKFT